MKIINLLTIFAITLVVTSAGCKKDDKEQDTNVITNQTLVQPTIDLKLTTGYVILAGSLISNVPTSAIT